MNPLNQTSFPRPPARFDIPSDSQAIGSAAFAIPDERHEDIGTEEDMLKIGLLGFGTVGRSIAEQLAERDCGIELRHILRRPGKAGGPLMTEHFAEIINDPEVDVVVDVLAGIEPSCTYIREALLAGKAVVTANKAALAANYEELSALRMLRGCPSSLKQAAAAAFPGLKISKKLRASTALSPCTAF